MTTISLVREGLPAIVWASPVYAVNELRPESLGNFTFEILERDGKSLQAFLLKKHLFSVDGGRSFWGELASLTPCTSTVAALALMRDRPALRGVLRIYPDTSEAAQ